MSMWKAPANYGISMEMPFALMNQLIWNLQIVHWRILLLLELALLVVVLLPLTTCGTAPPTELAMVLSFGSNTIPGMQTCKVTFFLL